MTAPTFADLSHAAIAEGPITPELVEVLAVVPKDPHSCGPDAGTIAYLGKANHGGYEPVVYGRSLGVGDFEIPEDGHILVREHADEYLAKQASSPPTPTGGSAPSTGGTATPGAPRAPVPSPSASATRSEPPPGLETSGCRWTGEISPQTSMNFGTKVLSRFATAGGRKFTVTLDVDSTGGTTTSKVEGMKVAFLQLGLPEDVSIKRGAAA
jgi:hypothetical protein